MPNEPCVDPAMMEWLKAHKGEAVRLDRSCLPILLRIFDFDIAQVGTIFGQDVEEYREKKKWDSLHLRDFGTYIEVHMDRLNPDWDILSFIGHIFTDVIT